MNPAAIAERLVEAVEQRDADAFAALYAEDAVGHHPLSPEPLRGRDAIRASEQGLFDAFSDLEVTVRSLLAGDDRCAVEVVLKATNSGALDLGDDQALPATGRRIEVPATWWFDVGQDGLIVETRDYFDTNVFMAQLGLTDQYERAPIGAADRPDHE